LLALRTEERVIKGLEHVGAILDLDTRGTKQTSSQRRVIDIAVLKEVACAHSRATRERRRRGRARQGVRQGVGVVTLVTQDRLLQRSGPFLTASAMW